VLPYFNEYSNQGLLVFCSLTKLPTSLLLGVQIQQHQEAVWAKDEHFHEQESRWKAQMQEMETFHMNNGRAITDQLNHLWHEHQLLVKQVGLPLGRKVQQSLSTKRSCEAPVV
jgi:hypothetical protein